MKNCMLYAVGVTVRHFYNNPTRLCVVISDAPDNKSGVKVWRNLDHPWTKTIIEQLCLHPNDLHNMPDGYAIELDEAIPLERGCIFSESVPPLYQRFYKANGDPIPNKQRIIDTVEGVIPESSGMNIDDIVKSVMHFRLHHRDRNNQHCYGVPNRKSITQQLAQYWVGSPIYDIEKIKEYLDIE